jgi:hypothetical protein
MHRLILAGALLLPTTLAAQASAYIPLDDPRLPLFEHLVTRGEVRDPAPMVRPFTRADALEVLAEGDTLGAPARRLIQELRAAWIQDTATALWGVNARLGGDASTSGNRDPLHPTGDGTVRPYGELGLTMIGGPVAAVSRSAIEPRLSDDPDWPGRHDLKVVGRMAEGYLSGQWRWARLFYGTMDRQWGPAGVPGIPLSSYGYPRTEFALEVGTKRLRLYAHSAELMDDPDTTGARVHRYWFAHRLSVRASERLSAALWETTIISGKDRSFDPRWRNPASVLLLSDQYGLGDDGNIMVGSDVTWWVRPHLRLEGQLALDDVNYPDPNTSDHTPSRYAFTVAASGPWSAFSALGAWKLLYTQASSLAFRTFDPGERYADGNVGLGRGYAGGDQGSFFLSLPVGPNILVTPELTYQRQGEGLITDSFPVAQASAGQVPTLFIGTIEKTLRLAVGVSGAYGEIRASGNAGLHYLSDADHVVGRSRTELEVHARVTIGLGTGGRLQ